MKTTIALGSGATILRLILSYVGFVLLVLPFADSLGRASQNVVQITQLTERLVASVRPVNIDFDIKTNEVVTQFWQILILLGIGPALAGPAAHSCLASEIPRPDSRGLSS